MDELIYELSKAEEEEAAIFYLMKLHFDNAVDLKFFSEKEGEKIKQLLSFLMHYSNKNRDLLTQAIKELVEKRKGSARTAVQRTMGNPVS